MTITLTRSAWKGVRQHSDDPEVIRTVDNLFELHRTFSGPPKPCLSCTMVPPVLYAALDAYRLWAKGNRGIGG